MTDASGKRCVRPTPGSEGVRRCISLFALLLVSTLALAAESDRPPSTLPEPTNERCLGCHDDAELTNDAGASMTVHASDLAGSAHAKVDCVGCHSAAESIRHPKNALGPVALSSCESCHEADVKQLPQSVHAKLGDEPFGPGTCAQCHDSPHITKNRANADAPSHPTQQSSSCGGCHKMAKRKFEQSSHAEALRSGNTKSPSCADCHTGHAVQSVANVEWRLHVSNEACGECHEPRAHSFRDNFHGQMAHLRFGGAAICADCHRSHDVLPASNAESSIAPGNLVETCGACHEQANANFVMYKPHAAPEDREKDPILWATMLFMEILIIGVFAFFGAHSILWFVRSLIERGSGK